MLLYEFSHPSFVRWFGHVQCMQTKAVKKSFTMHVDGLSRTNSRPKRKLMEVARINIKKCKLSEELVKHNSCIQPNMVRIRL